MCCARHGAKASDINAGQGIARVIQTADRQRVYAYARVMADVY